MLTRFCRTRRSAFALLLLIIQTSGCTSWRPQPAGVAELSGGQAPRQLRITLHDGTEQVIHTPRVRNDSIVGCTSSDPRSAQEIGVPIDAVARIDERRGDPGKSLALVALVGGVFVTAMLAAGSMEPEWGAFE